MPTNDITNVAGDDWQTQLMNYLRGTGGPPVRPNVGAAQPYDQAANPVFPPGSDVPGGGILDYSAATPGQPSMGYTALNQGGGPPAQRPYGGGGIGGEVNRPLTGWSSTAPSNTFAPNGGIGGDWRYPSQNVDPRLLPAAAGAAPAGTARPAGTATATPAAPRSVAPTPVVTPGAPNLGYYPPNPRFGTMQSQVPSGRGPLGNNPIYTTMNLFGGGQRPAAAPAAAAPAVASNAAVANAPLPPVMPPDIQNQRLASAVSQPNWWQNLGRPDMNPNQLASAVRKPNWWQNL
jgi:hypothetical protein